MTSASAHPLLVPSSRLYLPVPFRFLIGPQLLTRRQSPTWRAARSLNQSFDTNRGGLIKALERTAGQAGEVHAGAGSRRRSAPGR
jgi:hypothetical protein